MLAVERSGNLGPHNWQGLARLLPTAAGKRYASEVIGFNPAFPKRARHVGKHGSAIKPLPTTLDGGYRGFHLRISTKMRPCTASCEDGNNGRCLAHPHAG